MQEIWIVSSGEGVQRMLRWLQQNLLQTSKTQGELASKQVPVFLFG